MSAAVRHRGPDDDGVFLTPDNRVGLANRRLAIRDLSPAGHMPMSLAGDTLCITYNGEIYNAAELRAELARSGYAPRSTSDTELILAGYRLWGESVLQRLRGIFAFAILDRTGAVKRLFLARDQLGVKPLYVAQTGSAFLFASEIKALRASGLLSDDRDPVALTGYLLFGSVPSPWTLYREARAVEPGTCLTVTLGDSMATKPRRYWSLPSTPAEGPASPIEQTRAMLEDAIGSELVSDVPLGAFLSGGLDSSAVVALMRRATNGQIRTCSMVFEEAEFSEGRFARAMADAVGADHYERVVSAQDILGDLDAILAALDQPSVDGVNTYLVSETARQAGLTVALSGLGGDELFGGYASTFRGIPRLVRALQLGHAIPCSARVARASTRVLTRGDRFARLADALDGPASPAAAYLTRRGLFSPTQVASLVGADAWRAAREALDPVAYVAERAGPTTPDLFAWTSRAELTTYTGNQLLRDTDAMSMAHSLEVRVPLLDVRLVEHVLGLPDAAKLNARPKSLLLAALGDDLPPLIRNPRVKQGFTFPFDPWLRGPLRRRASELLASLPASLMRPEAVADVWSGFQEGRVHWSRPWALAVLGAWSSA